MAARVDDMLYLLDSPASALRARALLLLGHEQIMLPIERLTQLYDEGESEVHIAVLKYLIRNLPPGHHKIVLKALSDPTNSVRLEAVEYLTKCPTASAAPLLEALLKSPDFSRRDRVINALVDCNDGRAARVLMTLIEDTSIPERTLAGHMLSLVDVRPIFDELLVLLTSENEITVHAAISALENANDPRVIDSVLTVIDKWRTTSNSPIACDAIGLLDKFRDIRIRDTLLQLLATNEAISDVRIELERSRAIHMLGNYPEPQVIQYLLELLQHGSQFDRNAALHAFIRIGGTEVVEMLMTTCTVETDPLILGNYSYAFSRLGDKRAVPTLEALLDRVVLPHRLTIETNLRALNAPLQRPIHPTLLARNKSRLRSSG